MRAWLRRAFGATPRIATGNELQGFLCERAAFVSQRGTVEYCRARAGFNWDKLFLEEAFVEAMDMCRWEAFAAVAVDLAVIFEGYLRPSAGADPAYLVEAITSRLSGALHEYPPPAYLPRGWRDAIDGAERRLAEAQLAPPLLPQEVARVGANRLFDVLPLHSSVRKNDRELVVNNVRFQMAGVHQEMLAIVDTPALTADLRKFAAAAAGSRRQAG